MLPDSFLNWWFMPWIYAVGGRRSVSAAADLLGKRDAYRLWCAEAGVQPGFPENFDPGWHVAAVSTASDLASAARLFGGLIAARAQDMETLGQLTIAERRWCMSIAVTQPLKACETVPFIPADSVEIRGLVELARHIEHGFPGMWTRIRLLLAETVLERVEMLLPAALAEAGTAASSQLRPQRCWLLCRDRADAVARHPDMEKPRRQPGSLPVLLAKERLS